MSATRNESLDKALGGLLRTYRKTAGLSQSELGSRLGLSFQQLQKYERGINRVSVSRFCQIAEALGVNPHEILSEAISNAGIGAKGSQGQAHEGFFVQVASSKTGRRLIEAAAKLEDPKLLEALANFVSILAEHLKANPK